MSEPRTEPRTAIVACDGTYTYDDLDDASRRVAGCLLGDNDDLRQTRVAFLVTPSFAYAAVQRGVWRAGGVAVPLAVSHPPAELEYVIRDSGASVVVAGPGFEDVLMPLAKATKARFVRAVDAITAAPASELPHLPSSRRALIIYTSGTTGKPKGAVTTHENVGSQVAALVEAWGWRPSDRLLLVLPLHHVHGIINGLGSALAVRATVEVLPAFDADKVWERLSSGEITVFTAVPTIYSKLIAAWDAAPALQASRSAGVKKLRLMMSGSAALPVHILERWRAISGHTLLERYGMTEIGMALSNPLNGERRPGCVGQPLPNVDVHLVDEDGIDVPDGTPGELEVRGPAGRNGCGVSQRLVPHWRHGGARERLVPAARAHQRGHHQDRRLQSVGARDRGSAAHASGGGRVRGRRRERRGVGRTRIGGGRVEAGCVAVARRSAALGEDDSGALQSTAGAHPGRCVAAQRDGQSGQAAGCEAVRIAVRCPA
jgi:acyl-CoA synthetase (AMP-forming)/AMP-acid ligase II